MAGITGNQVVRFRNLGALKEPIIGFVRRCSPYHSRYDDRRALENNQYPLNARRIQ